MEFFGLFKPYNGFLINEIVYDSRTKGFDGECEKLNREIDISMYLVASKQ